MADTFKGHDIAAGIIYQDANIKVTAVENTHFRFEPARRPTASTNLSLTASTHWTVRSCSPATPAGLTRSLALRRVLTRW
jgi:hypothetical protein